MEISEKKEVYVNQGRIEDVSMHNGCSWMRCVVYNTGQEDLKFYSGGALFEVNELDKIDNGFEEIAVATGDLLPLSRELEYVRDSRKIYLLETTSVIQFGHVKRFFVEIHECDEIEKFFPDFVKNLRVIDDMNQN